MSKENIQLLIKTYERRLTLMDKVLKKSPKDRFFLGLREQTTIIIRELKELYKND